jgi:hypothetical protein
MLVRFETDAAVLHARWSVLSPTLALPHMPATGVSGLDLYARDAQGRDRWLAVAKPVQQKIELKLVGPVDALPDGRKRLYTVYLPLYHGTECFEIGVDPKASFDPVAPRKTAAPFLKSSRDGHAARRATLKKTFDILPGLKAGDS